MLMLIIDTIYVLRELARLLFVVVTSPFAVVGGLLLLAGQP